MDMIFAWQCHLGRCGGDGRRLHVHEAIKRTMRDFVLSNVNSGERRFQHQAFSSSLLISAVTGPGQAKGHPRSGEERPHNGHCYGPGYRLRRLDEIVLIFLFKKLRFCPQGIGTRQVREGQEIGHPDCFFFNDAVYSIGSQPFWTAWATFSSSAQRIRLHSGHEAGGILSTARPFCVDPHGSLNKNPEDLGSSHHMDRTTGARRSNSTRVASFP